MKKEFKGNNKGFSLIELIIVVAIMAILIGILAPQYLRFVERSRQSADRQNVDEIVRAIEIWAADTEIPTGKTALTVDATTGTTVTLSHTASSTWTVSGTNANAFTDAFEDYGLEVPTLRSSVWNSGGNVVLTIKVDANFNVTVEANDPAILNSSSSSATPTT